MKKRLFAVLLCFACLLGTGENGGVYFQRSTHQDSEIKIIYHQGSELADLPLYKAQGFVWKIRTAHS